MKEHKKQTSKSVILVQCKMTSHLDTKLHYYL
jgi:hypothetical protein